MCSRPIMIMLFKKAVFIILWTGKVFWQETEEKVSDSASYSLILRLRTLYIIDCLKKDRLWKKEEFLDLIKKISGSLIAYERYLIVKEDSSKSYKLPIEEAKRLMDYINKNNKIRKWVKEKKD